MSLHFVRSNKGVDQLCHMGFLHKRERIIGSKTIWKCASYHITKCPGRAHTDNGEVVKFKPHNHVADAAHVQRKEVVNEMKEKAIVTHESSQCIVCNTAQKVSTAVVGQLPKINSLKRTIQRTRIIARKYPNNPRTLAELIICDHYKKTTDGRLFLMHDSEDLECRFLVFTTEKNLDLLASCDQWFADGTFKSSPPLFNQLYTLHGVIYNDILPLVFVLMTNKRKETYKCVFQALKELKPGLRPTSVLTDFEVATMSAFQEEFPTCKMRGCFFHFCQCIWRHIQACGLQEQYSLNADFALHLRQLPSLAFVPAQDVIQKFENLQDTNFFVENAQEIGGIVNYFEDTWVGRIDRRGNRRQPHFKHSLWNQFDATQEGWARTNNSVEGWHNAFSSILESQHPNIWRFIEALQKEEALMSLKIEQYIAGQPPPPKKKKYVETSRRITAIVEDYGNRDTMEYLRGIAHNFQLQV